MDYIFAAIIIGAVAVFLIYALASIFKKTSKQTLDAPIEEKKKEIEPAPIVVEQKRKHPKDYTFEEVMEEYYKLYNEAQDLLDGIDLYGGISLMEDAVIFLDQCKDDDWDVFAEDTVSELISLYIRIEEYERAIALGERYQNRTLAYNAVKLTRYLEKYPEDKDKIRKAYESHKFQDIGDINIQFKDPYKLEKKLERAFHKLNGTL